MPSTKSPNPVAEVAAPEAAAAMAAVEDEAEMASAPIGNNIDEHSEDKLVMLPAS